jgi:RNA polymerase sigma-70 factor (ECF subfamily)
MTPRELVATLAPMLDERRQSALEQAVANTRDRHGVEVAVAGFLAHAAARVRYLDVESIHGVDLCLAYACATGDPVALARFDEEFLAQVPRFVAHIEPSRAFASEVTQHLRHHLFVSDGRPARIVEYSGRGPLAGWVRVAALRVALNTVRGARRSVQRERAVANGALLPPAPDPERYLVRKRCAAEVKEAVESVLSGMDRDARTALRMHYLDGLSCERIAALLGVHRATVARRIAQSRSRVSHEVRRRLGHRLGLSAREIESMMALVHSVVDVSVSRLIGSST